MMFYEFDGTGRPLGILLRQGLDEYRSGVEKLQRVKGVIAQMNADQITNAFRFINPDVATQAKAELNTDIPAFSPAQQQMLDQFG